jgi:hypothetical protein
VEEWARAARLAVDRHDWTVPTASGFAADDPRGDVPGERGDLTEVAVDYTDHGLSVEVQVAEGSDPWSDAAWGGDTFLVWGLDTDQDRTPDWLVIFTSGGTFLVDPGGNIANMTAWAGGRSTLHPAGSDRYGVRVPVEAIGAPTTLRVGALFFFDDDGSHGNGEPSVDLAPEQGLAIASVGLQPGKQGYSVASAGGGAVTFGSRSTSGPTAIDSPTAAIVGMATRQQGGTWRVGADGSFYPEDATVPVFGSLVGVDLVAPVAGIASTPSGMGYWLVGRDGGVFAFGDAGFHGSLGGIRLNQAIDGMA